MKGNFRSHVLSLLLHRAQQKAGGGPTPPPPQNLLNPFSVYFLRGSGFTKFGAFLALFLYFSLEN